MAGRGCATSDGLLAAASSSVSGAVCEDLERSDPDLAAAPSDAGVVVVDQAFCAHVSDVFNDLLVVAYCLDDHRCALVSIVSTASGPDSLLPETLGEQ